MVELGLLSTIFRDTDGKYVQISNAQLSQKAITNHRRSGPIEEPFKIDVAYTTNFMQLESLRTKMIGWLEHEGRDFRPGLNISIASLTDQSKMSVSTGIRYKSNTQDGGLKSRRRNRWVCAFRTYMAELEIFGPSGDPNSPSITRVAMVDAPAAAQSGADNSSDPARSSGDTLAGPPEYKLMDSKQAEAAADGAQTPGGLMPSSGGGYTHGMNTAGNNTPARVESPPPNPAARRRPTAASAFGPDQTYEMGRMA